MTTRAKTRTLTLLVLLAIAMPSRSPAIDMESLKLVAGQLPFPSLNFELGVKFSVRQTALLGLGDPMQALQAAEQQIAADPDDPTAHLQRGMALEALSREGFEDEYARAVELLKPLREADPDDVDIQVDLARAQVQAEAFDEAAPSVKELAQKHPELWWPHYALARRTMDEFMASVDWSDLSALRPLTQPEGDDPEAFRTRIQQIADNALMEVEEALRASPGEPAPRVLAVLIRTQAALWGAMGSEEPPGLELFAQMSDELSDVARDCPGEPQIQVFARWTTITKVLSRIGGGDEFSGLWRRLPADDQARLAEDELATSAMVGEESGQIPDAYELLAVYAMLHGDDTEAVARLKESTDQDPSSAERWEAYIGAITRTGDLAEIEAALRGAEEHVDSGKFRAAIAKVYQKRGEVERAEQELLGAIEVGDEYAPFAQLMLGVLKLKNGDVEGAIGPLRAAIEAPREPSLAEAALAVALALSGEQAEAAEHIAKAREIDPDDALYERAAGIIGK